MKRLGRGTRWIVAIAALVFVVLAVMSELGLTDSLDHILLAQVWSFRAEWANALAQLLQGLLAYPLKEILMVPAAAYLWFTRRRWAAAVALGAPPFTTIVVRVFKILFDRTRPDLGHSAGAGLGFPSGHAAASVAVYGMLALIICRYCLRSRWTKALTTGAAIVLVAATGLSRLYLAAHYPCDVVAGWALGVIILAAIAQPMERK